MNRFEIQLKALDKKMQDRVDEYKAIYQKADDERRNLDEQEQGTVIECHRALETLKEERENVKSQLKELEAVEELGRSLGPAVPSAPDVRVQPAGEPHDRFHSMFEKTIGEQFTDSSAYQKSVQAYRESGRLPSNFSTGAVALDAKGTLLEGAGGGGGAIAATVPQVIPGTVQRLFQRLTFSDLILQGQASTNSFRYVVEGTATSGAAGVAEGGSKPE
jgi:HK97 family phage major capsid protein